MQRFDAEGQLSNQQRDREANAGDHRDAQQIAPLDLRIKLSGRRARDEPRRTHDAQRLTDHETKDDAPHHGVSHRGLERIHAGDGHASSEEREHRNSETGRERADAVCEDFSERNTTVTLLDLGWDRETKEHACDGRVDTGVQHEDPREEPKAQEDDPWGPVLAPEEIREQLRQRSVDRDRHERKTEPHERDVGGVEDRDDDDRDEVVNHRECQEEQLGWGG